MQEIKVLAFDTGGTMLDWHGCGTRRVKVSKRRNLTKPLTQQSSLRKNRKKHIEKHRGQLRE